MKSKLILLTSAFILLTATVIASVPILYKNIDDINNVVIKFTLVDSDNRVIQSLDANSSGTKLFDNSTEVNINQFVTASLPVGNSTLAICFDLSISNRTNNVTDFQFAKDALTKCISYLEDDTKTALLSMANIACVEMDFTEQRNQIATAVNNFKLDPLTQSLFVSLYKGIASDNISGLSLLSNIEATNKTLLLVTQGVINSDETELLISQAKQNNVHINIIYISKIVPPNMQRLADQTGGFCISQDMIEADYLPMLASMAKLSEGYTPYTVQATGNLNCTGEHNFELKTAQFGQSNFYELIDSKQVTSIIAEPNGLEFPSVRPGTTSTKTVTLVAKNAVVNVTEITTSNPLFQITAYSKQLPLSLAENEELTLEITFTPKDSTIAFGILQLLGNACSYDTLYLTGGYPNISPTAPTVNIIKPNCNEVLVIGDTVDVVWNGVLAKDVVSLNTQTKNNQFDTFALNVTGLSHKYYINPNINTDSLRFIVNQMWPNNVGKTLTFKHDAPVKLAFFNTYEDKIITACNDNTVSIWNANSGALIHKFAQFNKEVRWVKFFKNPKLTDAEYIAVTCADSFAYLFDASDYSLVWRHKANAGNIFSIEVSPDSKYAVIAIGNTTANGSFDVIDLTTGELKQRIWIPAENCRYVMFHPTKKYEIMAISSWTGVLYFYNLLENADGSITVNYYDNIDAKVGITTLNTNYATYNHDGSKILLINYQTESLDLIDRENKKVLHSIQHSTEEYLKTPRFASFFYAKDGTTEQDYILTAGADNCLKRWNVSNGLPSPQPSIFIEHTQVVNTGVFSTDGWRLLSASDDSTAKIWNLNQKVLQTDTSCMLRVATAKCEAIDTIKVSDTYQGEISIKTSKDNFKNTCDFAYNIRSIRIVGENPTDFAMIDEFDYPFEISALGTLDFNIVFRPQATGRRTAQLEIIIPNDTIYIWLTGVGMNTGLQPLCELVNFGNLTTNDYKDTLVALAVNQSNRDIILSNISVTGPQQNNFNFSIVNSNNVLKPQDTLLAIVRFYSTTVGKKYSTLSLHNNYNNMTVKWNFMGNAIDLIQDTIELSIVDFTAKAGDVTACPIYINTKTKYQALSIDEIKFSIQFNSTLLYPQTTSNEVKILNKKYDNNTATIDIAVAYKPGQQQIDGLQFLALLGNDTTTLISIINCHADSDARISIVNYDALFTLADYCTADGVRLFDPAGKFVLEQNIPNPVANTTTIYYNILEDGHASLDIFNLAGNHIKNIFSEHKSKGEYSVDVSTQALAPGSYLYILQSGTNKQTKTMTITE